MNSEATVLPVPPSISPKRKLSELNWKQIGSFLVLTFGLTWTLDLILYLNGGLLSPVVGIALQFQMLLPAFSALLLGHFFFKDSPIYFKTNRSISRCFIWYFFLLTLIYAAAVIVGFLKPFYVPDISPVILYPSIFGLILLVVLRLIGGKESFSGVGMGGGKVKYWFLFALLIVGYVGLQTACSWLFKMGSPLDPALLNRQAALSGLSIPLLMIIGGAQTIILGPFLGLIITFGEEYGWRGYLMPAVSKIGRVWGVLIVGVIWGIWHWPIIWMGYNYPNHPFLGSLLMVLFSMGLAFLLGYAVFKSKGVWIAAFLHALVNQSFAFFMAAVYTPKDPAFSFGIGLPGLVIMIPLVLIILKDPVWKQTD